MRLLALGLTALWAATALAVAAAYRPGGPLDIVVIVICFAPAAAHLADGVSIEELGRAVDPRLLLGLEWPRPAILPGRLRSQAIYVDTFGNVKLSALAEDLAMALPELRLGESVHLAMGDGAGGPSIQAVWSRTFGEVAVGAPLLTTDSYGRVSLAVHQGSAAAAYAIGTDTAIEISRSGPRTRAPGPAR